MSAAQRIAITPSARLVAALWIVHAAAAAVTWAVPIPAGLKAWLVLAMGLSLIWGISRTAGLHAAQAIVGLEIAADGRLSFQTRSGASHDCELLPSSYVSPRLTILNLRVSGGGRVRHVVLVPDNIDPDDFRRLRAWLRWSAQPDAGPGAGDA